jgi:hypothetical protein
VGKYSPFPAILFRFCSSVEQIGNAACGGRKCLNYKDIELFMEPRDSLFRGWNKNHEKFGFSLRR